MCLKWRQNRKRQTVYQKEKTRPIVPVLTMFRTIGFIFVILLLPVIATDEDICSYISEDYCFSFGTSSCYKKMCECQLDNCTHLEKNCELSFWCSKDGNYTEDLVPEISLDCSDLKKECLARGSGKTRCVFYRDKCDSEDREVLAMLGKKKKGKGKNKEISVDCSDLKKECLVGEPGNLRCLFYRDKCNSEDKEVLTKIHKKKTKKRKDGRMGKGLAWNCANWSRRCAKVAEDRQRRHYTCRMVRNKCQQYANPAATNNSTMVELKNNNTTLIDLL